MQKKIHHLVCAHTLMWSIVTVICAHNAMFGCYEVLKEQKSDVNTTRSITCMNIEQVSKGGLFL